MSARCCAKLQRRNFSNLGTTNNGVPELARQKRAKASGRTATIRRGGLLTEHSPPASASDIKGSIQTLESRSWRDLVILKKTHLEGERNRNKKRLHLKKAIRTVRPPIGLTKLSADHFPPPKSSSPYQTPSPFPGARRNQASKKSALLTLTPSHNPSFSARVVNYSHNHWSVR
jgi:hypothetical protein